MRGPYQALITIGEGIMSRARTAFERLQADWPSYRTATCDRCGHYPQPDSSNIQKLTRKRRQLLPHFSQREHLVDRGLYEVPLTPMSWTTNHTSSSPGQKLLLRGAPPARRHLAPSGDDHAVSGQP